MAKKLWRSLLLLFLFVIIILAIQVSALKSQLEVRESAIENLVDETGVELIREFRQAVDQVKSIKYRKNYFETQNEKDLKESRGKVKSLCSKWRKVIPAIDFNLYCW